MNQRHRPRKRFGQHFLHDQGIIQHIINAISPEPADQVIEIGPGTGALTRPLLEHLDGLTVVELDRDLADRLETTEAARDGSLHVIRQDALKLELHALAPEGEKLRIVGNLPYNVSTPLMFHLNSQMDVIRDMHFMLQKEVVERICALPGERHRGRIGVMMQYHCRVENLFEVPPGAFNPPPKVDSAVVRLVPMENPQYQAQDPAVFAQLVKQAFSQRRKTLRNTLRGLLDSESIAAAGVDPGARAETLSVEAFVRLANLITRPPRET